MTRARRILNELFQQRYNFTKIPRSQHPRGILAIYGKAIHTYRFKTENEPMEVTLTHYSHPEGGWHPDEHGPTVGIEFGDVNNRSYDITGAHPHDVQRVLSTVHAIIRHHLAKNPDAKEITFSAAEPSRQRLYQHLINRFANKFHKERELGLESMTYTIQKSDLKDL